MSNLNNGQDSPHHARARAEMVERLRLHYHIRDERALDVYIRALRKKIEPNPSAPKYILTEPWVGYRFNDV